MKKKILVTGGTGFVGSHLIEALIKNTNNEVHSTQNTQTPSIVHNWLPQEHIHLLDISNIQATHELLHSIQPDEIYHLASVAEVGESAKNPVHVITMNTTIQVSLLDAIKSLSYKPRFLIVSSGLIYEPSENPVDEKAVLQPRSPYAVSKAAQELLSQMYIQNYNLDGVIARPFNHTGERQATQFVIPTLCQQIVKVERAEIDTIKVGNLSALRDFSDVKDVVQAYITIMARGTRGEVYNVGSGTAQTIQSVLDLLLTMSSKPVKIEIDPSRVRPSDVPCSVANSNKVRTLGWAPQYALTDTVQRVLNYWRTQ